MQLSLDGSLLSYTLTNVSRSNPSALDFYQPPGTQSVTSYGPFGSGFGIGAGYVLGRFVLGARAQLVSTSLQGNYDANLPAVDREATKQTDLSLFPRAEVMFDAASVRAFAALLVGVEHSSSTPSANAISSSAMRYLAGASIGVHAFLNDSVSIDPALTALGFAGWQSLSEKYIDTGGSQVEDFSTNGYRLMLTVGLSAWLGGAKR